MRSAIPLDAPAIIAQLKRWGVVSMCIGSGMGAAGWIEVLDYILIFREKGGPNGPLYFYQKSDIMHSKMSLNPKVYALLFRKFERADGSPSRPVIAVWIVLCFTLYTYFLSLGLNKISDSLFYDESQWIWVSDKYFGYVLKGDFRNPDWFKSYNTFGKYNPKIAQYLIGIPLALSGELNTQFNPMEWRWDKDINWNDLAGCAPPFRTLFYGRIIMPFLYSGCALLFLFITSRFLHWLPSLVATFFLGTNPLLLKYSGRALQEAPTLFFSLAFLAVLFSINWRKTLTKSRAGALGCALVSGFFLGLAVGTKMNNLVLVGVFGLNLAWLTMVEMSPKLRFRARGFLRLVWMSAAGLLMSLVVMVGSNPFLYAKNPLESLKRAKVLLELGSKVKGYKNESYDAQFAISSQSSKLQLVYSHILQKSFLHGVIGVLILAAATVVMLFSFGRALTRHTDKEADRLFLVNIATFSIFWINFLWIPMNWDRFFLPLLVPVGVLVGFAAEVTLILAVKIIERKPSLELRLN